MLSHDALIDRCFDVGPDVRYVAVYHDGILRSRERTGVAGASATESDRYEELLVNPTVLTLLRQRGNIDCGGFRYVLVRYGNFFAFVFPITGGHVALGLQPTVDLSRLLGTLERDLGEWAGVTGAA